MMIKNFFKKNSLDVIKAYADIEGWLSPNEATGLYEIAKKIKKNGVVLEIGSWKGKSTYCIAKGLTEAKFFALDPFNGAGDPDAAENYEKNMGGETLFDQFKNKLTQLGVFEKITPLVGYSRDFLDKVSEIDFLFIDGDHSKEGCEYDFVQYSPKVKSGGFIAFHDYYPERPELGPTWVINKYVLNSSKYKVYGKYDTLFVCKVN